MGYFIIENGSHFEISKTTHKRYIDILLNNWIIVHVYFDSIDACEVFC